MDGPGWLSSLLWFAMLRPVEGASADLLWATSSLVEDRLLLPSFNGIPFSVKNSSKSKHSTLLKGKKFKHWSNKKGLNKFGNFYLDFYFRFFLMFNFHNARQFFFSKIQLNEEFQWNLVGDVWHRANQITSMLHEGLLALVQRDVEHVVQNPNYRRF